MIQKLIHKAFNPRPQETPENVFKPRIQKTVKPDREYSFNEISHNIYKEVRR